ncbi:MULTISPECIES: helix-turn-helix domain-containing protein [unclassified Pseudoclavibacter]|uniref:winged helix-turn-helix transcriptional regulator n=1 Tax=unclassified Pseudoclavibacter TaxID=2615177 RepID=UPI000CE7DA54|nr:MULTISPECIES: helix-turn-helix domain-containing protein [unclassified Pseudoclavibacter]MBF4551146.1 helix-turn-helix transcriptional regulator [Pseudoclavibacter sp. VKM Ac-2888]PPF36066.1 transcriptional regulator [Pseudoclavibacter sp. AY1H1]PPF73510.1 transcriptional regulator [Pseudoclavibacter sp. Z016]PPG01475.1 transcriptional regulator [Pseudoclavibacter sp. RFBI5]
MSSSTASQDWTDPSCPVARTVDLVGDRWSLLVVRDAMDGARSFTDFQQRTGIARNILTDRLRKLISAGLLAQVDAPTGKRRVYELTEAGRDLFPVIVALRQWGEHHAFSSGEAHSSLVGEDGIRVPELTPKAADGSLLTSENTRVEHVAAQDSHP